MLEKAKQEYLKKYGFEDTHLKAVLFDMDGVLYDSMPNHAKSWAKACQHYNLHMDTKEAYLHEGRTGNSTINLLANRFWKRDATADEIKEIYNFKSKEFKACPPAKEMKGATEILENVKSKDLKIVLVTGSGQRSLLDKLNHSFPDMFKPELSVTSFDVTYGKPNPEPYLMALEKANIKPWEAIVVENAPLGVQAAVDAKIFTVGVNTGPLPDNLLKETGASLELSTVKELDNIFNDLYETLK